MTEQVTAHDTGSTPEPRAGAVRRYDVLDTPGDGALDAIARVATAALGTPMATVDSLAAYRLRP